MNLIDGRLNVLRVETFSVKSSPWSPTNYLIGTWEVFETNSSNFYEFICDVLLVVIIFDESDSKLL